MSVNVCNQRKDVLNLARKSLPKTAKLTKYLTLERIYILQPKPAKMLICREMCPRGQFSLGANKGTSGGESRCDILAGMSSFK